ncbi:MAG TPA: tyrosine-protein phosphatase [Aquabacterium sp.]|nr:tyrosine-protein phosphatase [Aquabacterium sp.]
MSFRSLTLPADTRGALLLSAMPGRFEPWPQAAHSLAKARVDLVVCLNPLDEIALVSPGYHAAIAGQELPCRWLHVPMRNFGLAEQAATFRSGVEQVVQALDRGETVLIHCAAGMGRTGSMAACVLKQLGLSRDEALVRVRSAGSNPESAVQTGLIDRF